MLQVTENEKKKTSVYVTQELEDAVLDAAHRRRIRGGWQGAASTALEEWARGSVGQTTDDLTPAERRAVATFVEKMRKCGVELAMRLAEDALEEAVGKLRKRA
jgi:hypothetical protein